MNNLNKFGVPAGLGGVPEVFSPRPVGIYQVPTDFVDLPSMGRFYSKDSPLYGVEKVEVKYMTAREEDLLISPALQKAGIAVDRVIESLLVDKRIRAKELLIGDKNAILINARKNAFGSNYEFPYICQKCGTQNMCSKDLNEVSIKELVSNDSCSITDDGNISMRLPKSGVLIELRFLRGEDEVTIEQVTDKRSKNNLPAEALITRYRYMILSVNGSDDTETIMSFINSMPIADSTFLRKNYALMNPDIEFNFSDECKNCSHVNEGGVPIMANFFWSQL
jgi:hypothetical protein